MPTPTPSRGTPAEPEAPRRPVLADDRPTAPVGEPITEPVPVADAPVNGSVNGSGETPEPDKAPEPAHRSGSLLDDAPEVPPEPAEPVEDVDGRPVSWGRAMLRRVRNQLPYGLVLLTMVIGLLRIVQYHWREGSAWIGGALLLAALLRVVLPPRKAGMVAVRGRAIDVLWCVGLAVCILFVAYTLKA